MINQHFKNSLFESLNNISGNKNFAIGGSINFVLPGLAVKDQMLSFPVTQENIEPFLIHAKKAPFGKGSETIYNESIRKVWEIDSHLLKFHNPDWENNLNGILKKVKEGLGLKVDDISAHLYKLLIYEEGHFFVKHRDSEKEKGMFGTLVVGLPSQHVGGSLEVHKGSEKVTFDFSENPYQINFAAFYADLEHEVKPLISGLRVCLVYNLVSESSNTPLSYDSILGQADSLAKIIKSNKIVEPIVITLEHQYTPANFSANNLKGNDNNAFHALQLAAEKSDFYASLCLYTSYMECEDESDDYYSRNSSDGKPEVYDEYSAIEHWADSEMPTLAKFPVSEGNVLMQNTLEEDEPIEKEETGYQGNYGMTVEYWYHYGAVALWPKRLHFDLLEKEPLDSKLNWLDYFVKKGENTIVLKTFFKTIEFNKSELKDYKYNFDAYLKSLLFFEDAGLYFEENVKNFLINTFRKTDLTLWKIALEHIGVKKLMMLLKSTVYDIRNHGQMIALINMLWNESVEEDKTVLIEKLNQLAENWVHLETPVKHYSRAIKALLIFSKELGEIPKQSSQFLFAIQSVTQRAYVRVSICENLMEATSTNAFTKELSQIAIRIMNERVSDKPQKPKDFEREVPENILNDKNWERLIPFLKDPYLETLEIRVVQNSRNEIINLILNSTTDLSTTVIKKGSPHLLVVSKTTRSFQVKLNEWREDEKLLNKLNSKFSTK